MSKAIYAFSGDPITFGHVDVVRKAANIFDELVVAIGINPDKKYMFSLEDRTKMAEHSLRLFKNVKVVSFTGLLIDFAYEQGVEVIIKGVRNTQDFEYEKYLNQLGDSQKLGIETVLLFADPKLAHISSSSVKAIQKEQGLIHEYVSLMVKQNLEKNVSDQIIISVTGEIGVGKSHVCKKLVELGKEKGLDIHHIELDYLAHDIYEKQTEAGYKKVRKKLVSKFGETVQNDDGTINRKVLGELVFNDQEKLTALNEIMYTPILVRLRRELYGKKGLILLSAALIAESDMAYLSNNNIVLVSADEKIQKERLKKRSLTAEQIKTRLDSQYDFAKKKSSLEKIIKRDSQGKIWVIDSSDKVEKQLKVFLKEF
jgi:pantetheine-phosphate adenylyltransferase/dephospho-CoA kinase